MTTDDHQRRICALRARAEEARTISGQMHHAETKAVMVRMAETYEKVARQIEALGDSKLIDDVG